MSDAPWQVLACDLAFPEGHGFAPNGTLWWVEIEGGCLGRLTDGGIDRIEVGGRPNGLAFDAQGRVWFCDQGLNAIRRYDPGTGQTVSVVDHIDGRPLGKPNDLAFDRRGNLVFTCSNDARSEPVGYVCCLTAAGDLRRIADGQYFPSGLAFAPDAAALVVAETYRQRLWTGTWNSTTATWSGRRVFADLLGPIGPDGMAFDDSGTLWVAIYGQGAIWGLDMKGGAVAKLAAPGPNPTNLAFDPSGRLGLVVTEAAQGGLRANHALAATPALFAPSLRNEQKARMYLKTKRPTVTLPRPVRTWPSPARLGDPYGCRRDRGTSATRHLSRLSLK